MRLPAGLGRSIRVVLVSVACCDAMATVCGGETYPFPYTDVAAVGDAFCPGIMQAYALGVTRGTSPTTFTPSEPVSRVQMTTFLQRSVDQTLRRSNRRTALGQLWTTTVPGQLQLVSLPGTGPATFCKSDGERVWVTNGPLYHRIQASTGTLLDSYDVSSPPDYHADNLGPILALNGSVLVADYVNGVARLASMHWESDAGGSAATIVSGLRPNTITFDGARVWTANHQDNSVAISTNVLFATSTASIVTGFVAPIDIFFDGENIWLTEGAPANRLRRLNPNGSVAQTIPMAAVPSYMAFDGANLWVPNFGSNSITVVQVNSGAIVATIPGNASNALNAPLQAAFDGERILVTNTGNNTVTIFRAADLSLIANVVMPFGATPFGACSDGINFWVTTRGAGIRNGVVRI